MSHLLEKSIDFKRQIKTWIRQVHELERHQANESLDEEDFEKALTRLSELEWSIVSKIQKTYQTKSGIESEEALYHLPPVMPSGWSSWSLEEKTALELCWNKARTVVYDPKGDPEHPYVAQWFIPWAGWNDQRNGLKRPAASWEEGYMDALDDTLNEWMESLKEESEDESFLMYHLGLWGQCPPGHIHVCRFEQIEEEKWPNQLSDHWLSSGVIPILVRGATYVSVSQDWPEDVEPKGTERFLFGRLMNAAQALIQARLWQSHLWLNYWMEQPGPVHLKAQVTKSNHGLHHLILHVHDKVGELSMFETSGLSQAWSWLEGEKAHIDLSDWLAPFINHPMFLGELHVYYQALETSVELAESSQDHSNLEESIKSISASSASGLTSPHSFHIQPTKSIH